MKLFVALFALALSATAHAGTPALTAWGQDAAKNLNLSKEQTKDLALAERDGLRLLMTASNDNATSNRTLIYCGGIEGGTGDGKVGAALCRGGGRTYRVIVDGMIGLGVNVGAFVLVASPAPGAEISGEYAGTEASAAFLWYGAKLSYFVKTKNLDQTLVPKDEAKSSIFGVGYQAGLYAELAISKLNIVNTNRLETEAAQNR